MLRIFDWMAGKDQGPESKSEPFEPPTINNSYQQQAWAYIEGIARRMAGLTQGSRNDSQNMGAYKAFRIAIGAGIDLDKVEDIIYEANVANGQVADDGDKQVRDTNRSARNSAETAGPVYLSQNATDYGNTTFDASDLIGEQPAPEPAAGSSGGGGGSGIDYIFEAEGDFWERPSLAEIRRSALVRGAAPWAVLGTCAARALATVAPRIVLPPVIGGRGSLNMFVALCTKSGGGKGASSAVAKELVPNVPRERNVGSGEGIVGAFYTQTAAGMEFHESVMFNASEVDTLVSMRSRAGDTSSQILRQGFSGETLGFSYITRGRDVHVEEHTYRMTLVVAVQPARAGGLLADAGGGTPQRFMWFPASDPRIELSDLDENAHLFQLTIPSPGKWQYPMTIRIPDEVRQTIKEHHVLRNKGAVDALDGHALFCREKFAFALAVLDGRTEMNEEDWRLSGIAAEVSSRTRAWVADEMHTAQSEEAAEKGRLLGVQLAESDAQKNLRSQECTQRVARWVLKKLEDGPKTKGELNRALSGRDRVWLPGAIAGLQGASLIEQDSEKRWVRK